MDQPGIFAASLARARRDYGLDAGGRQRGQKGRPFRPPFQSRAGSPDTTGSYTADPAGGITSYAFDALNRVTQVTAPGSLAVSFGFDDAGRQTQMTDATGITTYTFDEINRLTQKTVPGGRSISYAYDAAGNVTQPTDFAGQVTTRSYDKRNRLVSVTPADSAATTYTYDGANRWLTRTYPTGISTQLQRDAAGHITQLDNKRSDNTVISSFQYAVDPLGRVGSVVDSAGTTQYTYDPDGRLATVTEPSGRVTTYGYDGAGNRTSRSVTSGTTTDTTSYTYDASDRLLTMTPPTGSMVSYGYDLNGNMLGDGVRTFGYDGLNRLTSVQQGGNTIASHVYDGTGLRTQKTTASGTVQYYYGGDRVVNEGDGAGNITRTNLWGLELLRRSAAGQTNYYLFNGHGDVVSVLDGTGAEQGSYRYDAFGQPTSASGTVDNPFRYATEPYDEETGLLYLRARYYSPDLGRFVTQDTYKGNPWQPWTQNLYVYVGNDPINYTDPTGHFAWLAAGLFGGALVGGGIAGWSSYQQNECFWCWETWGDIADSAVAGAVIGGTLGAGAELVAGMLPSTPPGANNATLSATTLGEMGQKWLENLVGAGGQAQARFSTTLGTRVVDYFKDGVAYESKNGFVKWSSAVARQIDKDAELLGDSESGVTKVVWQLWKGASKEVLDYLADHGVEWVVH